MSLSRALNASFRVCISSIEHPRPCTPERVAILKALVARPELSLYVLNTSIPSANGLTPLALACSIGSVEQALALLECPSVLVDARDARGATPLMCTFSFSHSPILHSRASLDFPPSHLTFTLLLYLDAARKGRVEIVQHLVRLHFLPSLSIHPSSTQICTHMSSASDPSASPLSEFPTSRGPFTRPHLTGLLYLLYPIPSFL